MDEREFYLWVPEGVEWKGTGTTILGALQTKRHWQDASDLDLIETSLVYLRRWLEDHPSFERVALPLPGCGLGGLRREDVLPVLEALPDGVYVYER